jgi:AraC-like DNA-binding protein
MSERTFIILGDSGQLVNKLREAMPAARIIQTRCLDLIPPLTDTKNTRILVGHGTVPHCCLGKLDRWIADSSPIRSEVRAFRPKDESHLGLKSANEAWKERVKLLSPNGASPLVKVFIAAANCHDHEWFTVHEAADLIGLSVRQMRRLVERETGYSPHVLLHLVRIVSVVREMERTRKPLRELAESHHFADLSSMSRQFKRFVGQCPGAYRRQSAKCYDRIGQKPTAEQVN